MAMTNDRAIVLLSQMYHPSFSDEEKAALTVAIESLSENASRESVTPKVGGNRSIDGCWWYICPKCERGIDPKDPHCRWCGRELNWHGVL